ncbi:MAG: response regulator [Anaerolineales bacterium]
MRIILADHHVGARCTLKTSIEEQPEFDLVGEASDTQCLYAMAKNNPADIILIDRELPGSSIEDLIPQLQAIEPRPVVVVMSKEIEYGRSILKAGADAFVSKGDQPNWLLEKLRQYARQVNMNQEAQRKKELS